MASPTVERPGVERFLDAYRAAFEALEVETIADLFSYPCQITGDTGEVVVTPAEAAIAHNEMRRLHAAVERQRG